MPSFFPSRPYTKWKKLPGYLLVFCYYCLWHFLTRSLAVFSLLASPAARSFHLDIWGGHYPLSIGAVHLDGAHLGDGASLQEARGTKGHLPHTTCRDHTAGWEIYFSYTCQNIILHYWIICTMIMWIIAIVSTLSSRTCMAWRLEHLAECHRWQHRHPGVFHKINLSDR